MASQSRIHLWMSHELILVSPRWLMGD